MPLPVVKHGTVVKPRSRNKNGKIRKLRSDKGQKRGLLDMVRQVLPEAADWRDTDWNSPKQKRRRAPKRLTKNVTVRGFYRSLPKP